MKTITEYIVSKTINESKLQDKDIRNLMYNLTLPNHLDIDINIKLPINADIDYNYIIKHSCGNIIEATICGILEQKYNTDDISNGEYSFVHNKQKTKSDGVNEHCDCYIKNNRTKEITNIEIKAFTKLTNTKPTDEQWNADYMLLVKYKQSDNGIDILDYYIADPKDVQHNVKLTTELIQGAWKKSKTQSDDIESTFNDIVNDAEKLKAGTSKAKVLNIDNYCTAEQYGDLIKIANGTPYKDLIYALKNNHKLTKSDVQNLIKHA